MTPGLKPFTEHNLSGQLYLFVQEVEAKSKLVHSFTDKVASQFSVSTSDGTPHLINTVLRSLSTS